MLTTAPLSVFGEGWGLWNTLTSPNSTTAILEPSLSIISAPSSLNKDSISFQSILADIGCANISLSVFNMFYFHWKMIALYDIIVNILKEKTLNPLSLSQASLRIERDRYKDKYRRINK